MSRAGMRHRNMPVRQLPMRARGPSMPAHRPGMTMKIPFARTIAGAYRFAFANFLSVIGIGWFPYLVFAVVTGGIVVLALPLIGDLWLQDQKTFDQARLLTALLPLVGAGLTLAVIAIVTQAMVSVGVMRKALGMHPRPVFIYFSLGSQVWRLIGSYLIVLVLFWCAVALAGALAAGIALLLSAAPRAASVVAVGVLAAAECIFLVYAAVRLTFFIPAVVVAENHIGLSRSWRLAGGNFWRIFGIALTVTLPVAIAASMVWSAVAHAMAPQLLDLSPPKTSAGLHLYLETIIAAAPRVGPIWALIQIAYFVLLAGLSSGAVATAYRAVTGGDASKGPA